MRLVITILLYAKRSALRTFSHEIMVQSAHVEGSCTCAKQAGAYFLESKVTFNLENLELRSIHLCASLIG